MADVVESALNALLSAREQLEGYERDATGESYNDTQINAAIETLRARVSQAGAGGGVVKALEWSEHVPPSGEDCFYDHVRAKTPFGTYSIEWKSWKAYDWPTVDFQGEFLRASPTVDEAKAAAQADYEARILAALAPSPSAGEPTCWTSEGSLKMAKAGVPAVIHAYPPPVDPVALYREPVPAPAPADGEHEALKKRLLKRHGELLAATTGRPSLVRAEPSDVELLLDAALAIATPPAARSEPAAEMFQQRVHPWMMVCFGEEISRDVVERNHRFLEEALELVQSTGCTASEAHQLVDYVFARDIGETRQEIGGVMVTLAALCLALGENMHEAGEIELARIWTKVEAIRAKQAGKPKHSPLPQHVASEAPGVQEETL